MKIWVVYDKEGVIKAFHNFEAAFDYSEYLHEKYGEEYTGIDCIDLVDE